LINITKVQHSDTANQISRLWHWRTLGDKGRQFSLFFKNHSKSLPFLPLYFKKHKIIIHENRYSSKPRRGVM